MEPTTDHPEFSFLNRHASFHLLPCVVRKRKCSLFHANANANTNAKNANANANVPHTLRSTFSTSTNTTTTTTPPPTATASSSTKSMPMYSWPLLTFASGFGFCQYFILRWKKHVAPDKRVSDQLAPLLEQLGMQPSEVKQKVQIKKMLKKLIEFMVP